mgnify:CR=1 FL=1
MTKVKKQDKVTKPRKESDRIKHLSEKAKDVIKKRKTVESDDELTEIPHAIKRRKIDCLETNGALENDIHVRIPGSPIYGQIPQSPKRPFNVSALGKQKQNTFKHSPATKLFPVPPVNGVNSVIDKLLKVGDRIVSSDVCGTNSCEQKMDSKDEVDCEILDQNLNQISNCIKSENLQQLYERKILSSDSTSSPFKGKMSAFEISLLKGKQNLERRKSLESATLRASPRRSRHSNPRPNYSDTKRSKARLSLNVSSEKGSRISGRNPRQQGSKNTQKRKRTQSVVDNDISQSLESDNCTRVLDTESSKNKRIVNKMKNEESRQCKDRVNGFRRRNSLPDKLALGNLPQSSGKQNHLQGQSSSTLSSSSPARSKPSSQKFSPRIVSGRLYN